VEVARRSGLVWSGLVWSGLVARWNHLHRRDKSVVKLTFAKGASLKDPSELFNSSLEGNTRRAIDLHQGMKSMRLPSRR
jgi:hypothetical protein